MYGFGYIYRLYNQLKNLYYIKKHLNIIQNDINTNQTEEKQIENFENLKQIIFACGSIYIKFFIVSKMKRSIGCHINFFIIICNC